MPESTVKKSHKRKKNKSRPKRHKPKLTKEFKETEKEITDILNKTELSIDNVKEDAEDLGETFFCQTTTEPPNSQRDSPSVEEESQQSSAAAESPRIQTASSFIQVEDDDPIKWFEAEKIIYNENLLFFPSSTPNPFIQNTLNEDPKLKPDKNLIRMVNRYREEGNTDQITSGSSLKNQTNYFQDDLLYATECVREFNPIFYVAKLGDTNSPLMPSRKFITLNIKSLRFTQHPLQKEEHILANKLENYLEEHFERKEKQIIPELKIKLNDLRKIANELLEDGTTQNIVELEDNLNKLKRLRNKIHEEETISKDLVRNILDNWLLLKNLRKRQEFHWTSLKIKIKLIEADINADNAAYTKRFEIELNEIYREELEAYYRAKRLKKTDPEKYFEKIHKPNIEQIKKDLKKTLQKCSRAPGEPEMEIIRSNLSEPCRPLEKIRSYFLKILFDGQLVSSTRGFRLEPDLSMFVNESLGIYLDRRIPKEIKIKLYEKKKLPSMAIKVANITIPLPSMEMGKPHFEIINFSSHKQENVAGKLKISFNCDEGNYSEKMLNTIFPSDSLRTETSEDILSNLKKKFMEYSSNASEIDENQTSDEDDKESEDSPVDTCTFEETHLEFCSREEIDNNPRLRMLSSIYKRDMRTKDIRFVSYLDGEIEEDYEEKVIDMGNWMDPIDLHKHKGKKYLKNLYEVVRNHCDQMSLISGSSDDLLVGNSIVTLKSFFASLATMFSPRSPMSSENISHPSSLTYENVRIFNIVINVVRATGIPVRAFSTPNLDRRDSSTTSMFSSQTFKYSNVRPFVSATFMDKSARTMTADGSSPTWNEHLILQVTGNPIELKGDLKIAIFDEYVENHISEERSMEIYQRFQSNWLGEYRFPISTILANQKIEGVFELNSPKVFLGYNVPSLNEALPMENVPEIKERVNVWLYVSLDPSFDMPQVSMKNLECSELKDVRVHIQEWCIEAKDLQSKRFIDPLVCTMDGKRVCLTRLLEPIPLPIETGENLIDTACRYVSLLNVIGHFDPCTQFKGIWLNNETLLDTGWGSAKDLGILLANYLLTIGIRCWIVLGIAYPYGESAYVLYKEGNDYIVVDPSSGRKYSTKDSYCPVNKVFCIFSKNNIYCNIQSENRVSMMSFDIEDSSCWFPMFNKKNPAPLGGVQKLNYTYLNSNTISELRKNIERKIMKKISAWRPMQKTIWNRAFQNSMLRILVDLEYESTFTSIPSTINHSERLEAELGSYKAFGFTLNFSYINLSSVSERIKSTGIHLNSDRRVEFSVAVHIHAYPFNVLSVWIFIMSIVPT
ncbi:coiled-coil and C2 domain-containing protein 2A [Eupeodes corollae]|uniref:coiled-coil and C2 domain-containing protein 2A n=1 Tax=Eupeodes corollae TaxID=290404 RepID=UPI0024914996|nr:coiled-coil and C2 domain-containing protein 2A [Eupeodes corollae]XP_055907019.1 coiled-coil and C2 domain-containing protein 2A [Eupeodes corollae]